MVNKLPTVLQRNVSSKVHSIKQAQKPHLTFNKKKKSILKTTWEAEFSLLRVKSFLQVRLKMTIFRIQSVQELSAIRNHEINLKMGTLIHVCFVEHLVRSFWDILIYLHKMALFKF